MLKKATLDDQNTVLEMAKAFVNSTPYGVLGFEEKALEETFKNLVQGGVVYFNEHGFVAGMMSPLYFNPQVLIATELAWYCPEGDGGELREAFELWASANGAKAVQLSMFNTPGNQKLVKHIESLGYQAIEFAFIKELA